MLFPFPTHLRNKKTYRFLSRSIKRLLNRDSFFSCAEKYPELHKNIENFPFAQVGLNIDRLKVKTVALIEDENDSSQFYFKRFKSFLNEHGIRHRTLTLRDSSFIDSVADHDCLIFRPSPKPCRLDILREQVHFIEKVLHVPVFPSFDELMLYENKRLQSWYIKNLGFPGIPSMISSCHEEVLGFLENVDPPYVFKTNTGASASGVELIKTKETARKLTRRVFSPNGSAGSCSYMRQKDYVIIQEFVPNTGFDLRICVVGDKVFGYYRQAAPGDFRASGSGILTFGKLPEKAVRIAVSLRDRLDLSFVAVDFIENLSGEYLIVEFSTFIGHRTAALYRENGVPGWLRRENEFLKVELGEKCWFPDLMVKAFLEKNFSRFKS